MGILRSIGFFVFFLVLDVSSAPVESCTCLMNSNLHQNDGNPDRNLGLRGLLCPFPRYMTPICLC